MNTTANRDEFLHLIEQNKGIIIKICNSYCRNVDDRQDLAQEMIYQLWKSGNSFNQEYKFTTWMYRVALNVAISFYRKQRQQREQPINEWHINIEEAPAESPEKERNISLLQEFISQMKELDKAMILLWSESRSYKEISEIVGITETNVATRISRLKLKLKQQFSQHQKP
ncbi:MAG: RNA polymerase sigma factor [Chitinophagaceae bacterium]|nr:MAG: RNA polymerase sigma factor [Chitinophagaceae bacterium]